MLMYTNSIETQQSLNEENHSELTHKQATPDVAYIQLHFDSDGWGKDPTYLLSFGLEYESWSIPLNFKIKGGGLNLVAIIWGSRKRSHLLKEKEKPSLKTL